MNSFHALRGFREYLIYSQISRLRDLLEVTPITTNCGKCQKSSYNFLRIIFLSTCWTLDVRIEHIWKWLPNSGFAFSLKSYWVVNHPLLGDLTYLKSTMKRSAMRNKSLIYSRVSNNRTSNSTNFPLSTAKSYEVIPFTCWALKSIHTKYLDL